MSRMPASQVFYDPWCATASRGEPQRGDRPSRDYTFSVRRSDT